MEILKEFFKKYVHYIIICLLSILLIFSVSKCISDKHYIESQSKHNITALTDSINYYKGKNGDLIAEKTVLVGDIDLLKQTNEDLYNKIKNMNVKNPDVIVDINSTVDMGKKDTVFVNDTIYQNLYYKHSFDFSNKYRKLDGNIYVYNDSTKLFINNDKVFVDYTLAIKDGKIFVTSDNPYVQYNNINGITLPKPKQKKWGIGPAVSFGYDPIQNKPSFNLGISVSYHLLQW